MNVAALLQDSPSEDRRRNTNSNSNPDTPAAPPAPSAPAPSSPQWPRQRAPPPSTPQSQQWAPPPYIRPASAHSSADPPPPAGFHHDSRASLARSRAGSHASQTAASPPTPFHPALHASPAMAPLRPILDPAPPRTSSNSASPAVPSASVPPGSWGTPSHPGSLLERHTPSQSQRERSAMEWQDRDRERDRDRRRLSNASDRPPPTLVGPGTGVQPYLLNDEKPAHERPPPPNNTPMSRSQSQTIARQEMPVSRRLSGGERDREEAMRDRERDHRERDRLLNHPPGPSPYPPPPRDRDHPMRDRAEWDRDMREREMNRDLLDRDRPDDRDIRDRDRDRRDRERADMDHIRAAASHRQQYPPPHPDIRDREREGGLPLLPGPGVIGPGVIPSSGDRRSGEIATEVVVLRHDRDRERDRERGREWAERERERTMQRPSSSSSFPPAGPGPKGHQHAPSGDRYPPGPVARERERDPPYRDPRDPRDPHPRDIRGERDPRDGRDHPREAPAGGLANPHPFLHPHSHTQHHGHHHPHPHSHHPPPPGPHTGHPSHSHNHPLPGHAHGHPHGHIHHPHNIHGPPSGPQGGSGGRAPPPNSAPSGPGSSPPTGPPGSSATGASPPGSSGGPGGPPSQSGSYQSRFHTGFVTGVPPGAPLPPGGDRDRERERERMDSRPGPGDRERDRDRIPLPDNRDREREQREREREREREKAASRMGSPVLPLNSGFGSGVVGPGMGMSSAEKREREKEALALGMRDRDRERERERERVRKPGGGGGLGDRPPPPTKERERVPMPGERERKEREAREREMRERERDPRSRDIYGAGPSGGPKQERDRLDRDRVVDRERDRERERERERRAGMDEPPFPDHIFPGHNRQHPQQQQQQQHHGGFRHDGPPQMSPHHPMPMQQQHTDSMMVDEPMHPYPGPPPHHGSQHPHGHGPPPGGPPPPHRPYPPFEGPGGYPPDRNVEIHDGGGHNPHEGQIRIGPMGQQQSSQHVGLPMTGPGPTPEEAWYDGPGPAPPGGPLQHEYHREREREREEAQRAQQIGIQVQQQQQQQQRDGPPQGQPGAGPGQGLGLGQQQPGGGPLAHPLATQSLQAPEAVDHTEEDDMWEEMRAEAEGQGKRSRVRVDLGTWVYPNLPFPYFFELGSGLVGAKDREDERERREKDRLERERVQAEREKKDREERERIKKEKEQAKELERQEREEKERKEKEQQEREAKEKAEKEKAAKEKLAEAADKKEEGEIDEDDVAEPAPMDVDKEEVKPVVAEVKMEPVPEPVVEKEKVVSPKPIPVRLPDPPPPPPPQREPPQPQIDVETRTTIIIPSGFIPTDKPLKPRLWGGGALAPFQAFRRPKHPINPNARHRPSHSKQINLLTGVHVVGSTSKRARNRRRVYTDDSDVLLCAVHSGWLSWSGALKARELGRDIRIDVRVIRVAGAGSSNIFAKGVGGMDQNLSVNEGGDPAMIREEMVGRFQGGFGERCFNTLGMLGRMVGEELDRFEKEVDASVYDDPEDDGRSLVSGAWGTGHDGSAIEIVGVEFVKRGTAHKGSGLGRSNRSQRMAEYAERRAAVMNQPCAPRLAGRKRRRNWDNWPVQPRRLPNATVLEMIQEVDEENEDVEPPRKLVKETQEGNMMDVRTMVFGMSASGDLCVGYKYVPSLLNEILFPSPRSAEQDAPRPRKRRRLADGEDTVMTDAFAPAVDLSAAIKDKDPLRPIILETSKESYLLSPNILTSPDSNESRRLYDIGLVLEADLVVEEEPVPIDGDEKGQPEGMEEVAPTKADDDARLSAKEDGEVTPPPVEVQVNTAGESLAKADDKVVPVVELPKSTTSPVHSPEPLPGEDEEGQQPPSSPLQAEREKTPTLLTDDDIAKPQFAVQILQRNLTKDMFRFTEEGVYVLDGSGEGVETEWAIQVRNWKWAPKGARERML